MKNAIRHLKDRPFASAIFVLVVTSSVATLLNYGIPADALSALVPSWLLTVLAVVYGVSGLLILAGMATQRANIEAAGCVLLLSGLVIRGAALVIVVGWDPLVVTTAMFYLAFAWACIERLRQIISGQRIVRITGEVDLDG